MTFEHDDLDDGVEYHGELEPGIYRIDIEAMFGHVRDPEARRKQVEEYAKELKDGLPDGSIILPVEVDKVAAAEDSDDLVTRDEAKEIARTEARQIAHEEAQTAYLDIRKELDK